MAKNNFTSTIVRTKRRRKYRAAYMRRYRQQHPSTPAARDRRIALKCVTCGENFESGRRVLHCRTCLRQHQRQYRRAYMRRYRQHLTHSARKKMARKRRAYYRKNRDRICAYMRAYMQRYASANSNKLKEYFRRYDATKRSNCAAHVRAYRTYQAAQKRACRDERRANYRKHRAIILKQKQERYWINVDHERHRMRRDKFLHPARIRKAKEKHRQQQHIAAEICRCIGLPLIGKTDDQQQTYARKILRELGLHRSFLTTSTTQEDYHAT